MYRRKRTRWLAPRRPATFVSVTRFVSKWLGTPIVVRVTGLGCRIRVHLVSAWSAATDRAWKSRLIKIANRKPRREFATSARRGGHKDGEGPGIEHPEIAALFELTSERVAQILKKGLAAYRKLARTAAAGRSGSEQSTSDAPYAPARSAKPNRRTAEVNPSSAGLGKTADLAGAAAGLTLKTAKLICAVPPWQGTKF